MSDGVAVQSKGNCFAKPKRFYPIHISITFSIQHWEPGKSSGFTYREGWFLKIKYHTKQQREEDEERKCDSYFRSQSGENWGELIYGWGSRRSCVQYNAYSLTWGKQRGILNTISRWTVLIIRKWPRSMHKQWSLLNRVSLCAMLVYVCKWEWTVRFDRILASTEENEWSRYLWDL